MIEEFRERLRRLGARRVVGVLLLAVFVLFVALAATHVHAIGDADHHDDCGVCVAVAAIGTSETFVAPALIVAELEYVSPPPAPAAQVLSPAELPRVLAPRPPPALA